MTTSTAPTVSVAPSVLRWLRSIWLPLAAVVLVKLLVHLATNGIWGFHRDEFLYLAMGRHLDWGYWSNPPLIGFLGWLADQLPVVSPWTVRVIPTLAGTGVLVLTGLLARELGGGRAAVAMAALSALLAPAMLRTSMLFQPVVFDILGWTLCFYLIVRFVNTRETRWLWWLGAAVGLGLLNKYSLAVLVLGALASLPLTRERSLFREPRLYGAMGLAALVVLPNLVWQAANGFPVVSHMQTLRETQLVNVLPADFLLEQLLLNLPVAFVWLLGLLFLFSPRGQKYRLVGWIYVAVLVLLLVLGGKSYYTLGLYPVLFAAGAVWIESRLRRSLQVGLFAMAVAASAGASPFAIPYLQPTAMVGYGAAIEKATGIDALLRWEDGRVYPLPQDYADMLGWRELADLIDQAYRAAPDPARTLVYCENYGQAGAALLFHGKRGIPEPVSFSDSFRLWAPRELPADFDSAVYVNDELGEDVAELFEEIRLIGTLETPYARERGTKVYLLLRPRASFPQFWKERVSSL